MQKVFNYNTDSGHGWITVPKKLLRELHIEDKISGFSYQRNDTAYLEEDCDASLFIDAYVKKYNIEPKFKEFYQESSPIRRYEQYYNEICYI